MVRSSSSLPKRPQVKVPRYLSAQKLAELALPKLPTTKSGIIRRAERDDWEYRDIACKGGEQRQYAIKSLPIDAQSAMLARFRPANENVRERGRPKGSTFFTHNADIANAVIAILAERKLSAPRVMELLSMRYVELPSLRSLQRFIGETERQNKALLSSTRNPDEYKGRYRLALGRADGGVSAAHQVWELDTTKADVLTRGGRMMVLGLIDRWSRRARFLVVPSESGQSVRRLLVDTIRAWGVMPNAVATDNGSGFINQSIISALEILGIEHMICPPGSPEKKPFVERLFGTFTRERAELLQGYAGHSVAEAQALRAKARKDSGRAVIVPEMTATQLQEVLTSWTEGVYHQRTHSGIKTSPMKKWLSSPEPARSAPDNNLLKIALSAYEGERTVGKRGVQWKEGRYWAPALAAYMGQSVSVRRDEDDLGALFIFDSEGQYIDTAINHARAGLSEEAFAKAARAQQDAFMAGARAELRQHQRSFNMEGARDALLRADAEAAGKLLTLPMPTRSDPTPAMNSINDAEYADSDQTDQSDNDFAPAISAAPTKCSAPLGGVAAKVREADAILLAADRGETVDDAELSRARAYASSSEYRTEKMISAHFDKEPAQSGRRA